MVNYWDRQHFFDVLISAFVAVIAVEGPKLGTPALVTLTPEGLVLGTRAWVGPALTLLGMMSATTAFIFSVVDRDEFKSLKALGVEAQLWKVFSENILWLAIASLSAIILSFSNGKINDLKLIFVSFLFSMISICIIKFSWVMRQIISVRASK